MTPPLTPKAKDTERVTIRPGELVTINGKVYTQCVRCGSIIRFDKPIFGSLHVCA